MHKFRRYGHRPLGPAPVAWRLLILTSWGVEGPAGRLCRVEGLNMVVVVGKPRRRRLRWSSVSRAEVYDSASTRIASRRRLPEFRNRHVIKITPH